jgi:hypothetical protein
MQDTYRRVTKVAMPLEWIETRGRMEIGGNATGMD